VESYAYQFAVGGLAFLAGVVVAWRTGQIGLEEGRPRRRLLALLFLILFFAAFQGGLLWLAHG
jgi:hypothetical protein